MSLSAETQLGCIDVFSTPSGTKNAIPVLCVTLSAAPSLGLQQAFAAPVIVSCPHTVVSELWVLMLSTHI